MALWQYNFIILPKKGYTSLFNGNQLKETEEYFDDSLCWKYHQITVDLFDDISNILKRGKSWHHEVIIWGEVESNCLEITVENNMVVSASFRIDFQCDYENILSQIIIFCKLNEFVILNEDLQILPLNAQKLTKAIESSPQFLQYVKMIFNNK